MAKAPNFEHTRPDISQTTRTGKGMPARTPEAGRPQEEASEKRTQQDVSAEASLSLPHERDQSTDMTADKPDPAMQQAKRDVDSGKQDTGKQPEMNSTYQKQK